MGQESSTYRTSFRDRSSFLLKIYERKNDPRIFVLANVADTACFSRIRFFPIPQIPGQKDSRIPDSDPDQRICILAQKIIYKLSETRFGLFIPDPDLDFLPISDPGVKNAQDLGYGSATLPSIIFIDPVYC